MYQLCFQLLYKCMSVWCMYMYFWEQLHACTCTPDYDVYVEVAGDARLLFFSEHLTIGNFWNCFSSQAYLQALWDRPHLM